MSETIAPTLDLYSALSELASRRTLFHSEADFQHAFAWQIQENHPDASLRFEPRPGHGVHLDLLAVIDDIKIAFELRYLPKLFRGEVNGELYELAGHASQDIARHDVVNGIVGVETLLTEAYADYGWVVTLSNDPAYWKPALRANTVDAAFRLHNGRNLAGDLKWADRAGIATTRKRDKTLALNGSYVCRWRPFSTVLDEKGRRTELRYLALPVGDLGKLVAAGAEKVAESA